MDCPRLLFLLVEDRLLLSPHLIDQYTLAVSSTKLCVHTYHSHHPSTARNTCLFSFAGSLALSPREKPGDIAFTHAFVSITVYVEN